MKKWKMVLAGAAMTVALTFGTAFVPSNDTAVAFAADRYVCDVVEDEENLSNEEFEELGEVDPAFRNVE